jgi:hypothetical protein
LRDPLQLGTRTLAVVSVWSLPHEDLWERSHNTCYSSIYEGQDKLVVIDVHDILTVVAMVQHTVSGQIRFFLVEKPGLSVISYNGVQIEPEAEEFGAEELRNGEYWESFW